jgi:hypothetical protein
MKIFTTTIKFIAIGVFAVCSSSCANRQYVDQMVEIERSRQAGRITEAEYLQLKGQAQLGYETEAQGSGIARRALDRRATEAAIQERLSQQP